MRAEELVADLAAAGVRLFTDAGRLRYQAGPGAYTDALRALVAEHRGAIVAFLAAAPVAIAPAADVPTGPAQPPAGPGWHPSTALIEDPAKHWDLYRARFPAHLAALLGPLAAAWGHSGAGSLRMEYTRIVGWFKAEPATTSASWASELAANWRRDGGKVAAARGKQPSRARMRGSGASSSGQGGAPAPPAPATGPRPPHPETAAQSEAPANASARGRSTPAEHLAELGGHDGARDRFGLEVAHRLWDTARLWERDRETERAGRWARAYWLALSRAGNGARA